MSKSIRILFVAIMCAGGVLATSPEVAHSQESKSSSSSEIGKSKKIGVGLGGGSFVSGLSGKFYMGETSAIQANAGFGFGLGGSVQYIIKEIELMSFGFADWDLALGVGAGFATSSWGFSVGPHANIGLSWKLKSIPLEFSGAYRPGFYFGDNIYSGLNFGYGGGALRWYF